MILPTSDPHLEPGTRLWLVALRKELWIAYQAQMTGRMPQLVRENERWMSYQRVDPDKLMAQINRLDAQIRNTPLSLGVRRLPSCF